MCILFIAVDQHPRYPLIIAANRDEYHARPSEPMHYWPDQPGILAGRDRRAGGTWFGVNAGGRIAAVANHRVAAPDGGHTRSRGELVARFLGNSDLTENYAGFLHDHHRDFAPFNLVYGEAGQLYRFSSAAPASRPFEGGLHSISNGAPNDQWPKMSRGVALLTEKISSGPVVAAEQLAEHLARMMKDQTQADSAQLPQTGLAPDREKHLSSIFITGADYGTRTTTLLFHTGDEFDLYEYNYSPDGSESNRRQYSVAISAPNKTGAGF